MAIITKQGNTVGMYKGRCQCCGCEFLWVFMNITMEE